MTSLLPPKNLSDYGPRRGGQSTKRGTGFSIPRLGVLNEIFDVFSISSQSTKSRMAGTSLLRRGEERSGFPLTDLLGGKKKGW